MQLLTPELEAQLSANLAARIDALSRGEREPDPKPVVRLFSPVGSATWLATEIDADGIFFGLADLGFGCPELGSFALSELESVRLPFGLTIERDLHFTVADDHQRQEDVWAQLDHSFNKSPGFTPAFLLELAVSPSRRERARRQAVCPVLGRVEPRKMLADDLGGYIVLEALRAGVPVGDEAVRIKTRPPASLSSSCKNRSMR